MTNLPKHPANAFLGTLRSARQLGVRSLTFFALLAVMACAHPSLTPREIGDSQLITEDEIVASRSTTAYEAIKKLRANFLTYRGETGFSKSASSAYPNVFIDGQHLGPISTLSTVPASQVSSIRLYRAWEATTQFGTGNMSGVISISTRQ